jgi:hypothetical protein
MTAFCGKRDNDSNKNGPSVLGDSIEELASMLLDDTTMNQLAGEPGKRLSKLGSAKILPQPIGQAFFHDKALPQLPKLSFSGNDEWTTRSYPVATAAGISSEADPLNDEEELDSCPPPVSRQPAHSRKGSAPPLPRKSSKRSSRQREQRDLIEVQNSRGGDKRQLERRKIMKMTNQNIEGQLPLTAETQPQRSVPTVLPDVSQQIESMLVASRTLKPRESNSMTVSPVVSKKNGMKGNGVLSKMKMILNGHFHDKGLRKHLYAAKNEHLLDPNLSQLPDYDEEASTISAIELRMNEGWKWIFVHPLLPNN